MDQPDYAFRFTDIAELSSPFRIDHPASGRSYISRVAVGDKALLLSSLRHMPSEVADIVDLAVAVHAVDRMSHRGADVCSIHVSLPVRHPEILTRGQVLEQLQQLLYWYTGDHWSFEFVRRTRSGRTAEVQPWLPLQLPRREPHAVVLWSGGLDALAGLYTCLSSEPMTHYTLLGTGSNTMIYHTQQRVARSIDQRFPQRTTLVQTPLRLAMTRGVRMNATPRARGFVFLLLGVACAYMQGLSHLWVYENGVGAINLPFRPSEVGLDHSRSVHPLSLLRMNDLVSQLLPTSFMIANPFLFSTKAQMCTMLAADRATDLVRQTVTCDRRHRKHPMQCGRCSSCLLRRQALAAVGIVDPTRYVATGKDGSTGAERPMDHLHLHAMLYQVDWLRSCFASPEPWRLMVERHPVLLDIVDALSICEGRHPQSVKEHLKDLYQRYAEEWQQVRQHFRSDHAESARLLVAA